MRRAPRPRWPRLACVLLVSLACAGGDARVGEPRSPQRRALDGADLALARGQLDAAESAYRAVLGRKDGSEEIADEVEAAARLGLARVAAARGDDLAVAVALYDALGAEWPAIGADVASTELCPLLLRAGEQALARADPARARELARRAGSEPCAADSDLTGTPPAATALGAARELERRALLGQAEGLEGAEMRDPAIDLYRAADALAPLDARSLGRLTALLRQAGRRREAMSLLSRGLASHPRDRALQAMMVELLAE